MAKEYIEREALLKKMEALYPLIQSVHLPEAIRKFILEAPAADVVEVRHGRNLKDDTPSLFECSVCNWCSYDTLCGDTEDYNYCPNCGARMDGAADKNVGHTIPVNDLYDEEGGEVL